MGKRQSLLMKMLRRRGGGEDFIMKKQSVECLLPIEGFLSAQGKSDLNLSLPSSSLRRMAQRALHLRSVTFGRKSLITPSPTRGALAFHLLNTERKYPPKSIKIYQ
jgi:hypothetical protein